MEMAAVQKDQTIKRVSSQLTWKNPVMEVKLRSGNVGLILSGFAIKIYLMHGCSFYYWSRGRSSAGEGLLQLPDVSNFPGPPSGILIIFPLDMFFSVINFQLSYAYLKATDYRDSTVVKTEL